MLHSPKNLSWPSRNCSSRRKARRQPPGETNGNSPSSTSTSPSATQNVSPFKAYFFAGAWPMAPLPRNALKNSVPAGSSTITSPFLLKVAL